MYMGRSLIFQLSSYAIIYILFLLCLFPQDSKFFSFAASLSNETDYLSLLEFKAKITNDPLEVLSSWNNSVHFCQWHGVTCARRHQRVARLDLPSSKLEGLIPSHIGNLSFLWLVALHNNSLVGKIPPEIGRLRRLKELFLHNNSLSGEIPHNISACINLEVFQVSRNRLDGKIPPGFGTLSKLTELTFTDNQLDGSLSPLGNLSSLSFISVTGNNFHGRLPSFIAQLRNLISFAIAENMFSGNIWPSFYNLSSLRSLDLGTNQIHGTLPQDLGNNLPRIEFLSLAQNQFTGKIPASLSNATNLHTIAFGENKFKGVMPTLEKLHKLRRLSIGGTHLGIGNDDDMSFLCSLTNATHLEHLAIGYSNYGGVGPISNTNFGGVLPECIGNLSSDLRVLMLQRNRITGHIPAGITNLVALQSLVLVGNKLSGSLPSNLGKLQNLRDLGLDTNRFVGSIPDSLGNLTKLTRLTLSRNNLNGTIPGSLKNCQNLLRLDLSYNNLSGLLPPGVLSLSSLSVSLVLSNNQFSGFLPTEIGNLNNLGVLDVSHNMLSGEIPKTLGNCIMLEFIDFDGNLFQGEIPSTLSSLKGITYLDFSHNNLSGKIPTFLESLNSLRVLNLSYNEFEGMVPVKGIFENISASSLIGNRKLCGGLRNSELPPCKSRRSTSSIRVIIITTSGVSGVILVVSLLFVCWLRKKQREAPQSILEESSNRMSYQTLHNATSGFSLTNLIGMGSFGSVYKGVLDQERIVAIKVLNLLQRGASKSFLAECEAMRNVKHRNLVKILTVCSGIDYHGNDFKALVYNFMVNGSLEDRLHPTHQESGTCSEPRVLTFRQRLNIAIDVACALDYLHNHCQPTLAHCDVKPSNVLLDEDMVGHLGDFGLAKFHAEASFSSSQSSSIAIRGTIGYAAPEYGMGSQVSAYGDIYSYGILLLEMFTGKRPTEEICKEEVNLHDFVKAALPNQVEEIIDPVIWEEARERTIITANLHNSDNLQNAKFLGCLISIFEIGVSCSITNPGERMSTTDAISQLCSIRDKLDERHEI